MRINLNLTKEELIHLENCDTENDACWCIQKIIKKVRRKIKRNKKFKSWLGKSIPRMTYSHALKGRVSHGTKILWNITR